MKTSVKVRLGLGVLVIGVLTFVTITTTPWGSANLATCRIVEAEQLANDSVPDEGDPPVAPVPPPGELFACQVLFPDSHPVNPSAVVAGGLVFYGGIGTAIYLYRRRKSPSRPARKDGLAGRD
jgi:hypothetical protein